MNGILEVLLALAIVMYVIVRQVRGEALRGKRVVVLPLVVAVVGFWPLGTRPGRLGAADLGCLAVGAVLALGVGVGQGASMRLESRGGALWGRMPVRGLWWWAALIASRLAMTVVAHSVHAQVAASTAPVLALLGLNRVGQAVVIAPRALRGSVPFAPERDGSVFGRGGMSGSRLASRLLPARPPLDDRSGSGFDGSVTPRAQQDAPGIPQPRPASPAPEQDSRGRNARRAGRGRDRSGRDRSGRARRR